MPSFNVLLFLTISAVTSIRSLPPVITLASMFPSASLSPPTFSFTDLSLRSSHLFADKPHTVLVIATCSTVCIFGYYIMSLETGNDLIKERTRQDRLPTSAHSFVAGHLRRLMRLGWSASKCDE